MIIMAWVRAIGGNDVAQKIVKIFLDPDTISRLKNRAGREGRSTSECARLLLESGLENRSVSGPDPLERPNTMSPEENVPTLVREILSSGLGELKAEIRDLKWALFNAQEGPITARDQTLERESQEADPERIPHPESAQDLKTGGRERLALWWDRQLLGVKVPILGVGMSVPVFLVVLAIGDLRAPRPTMMSPGPSPGPMSTRPRVLYLPPLHSNPHKGRPGRLGQTPGTGGRRTTSPPALSGWRVIGVSGTGAVLVDPQGLDHLVRKGREIQGVSVTGIDQETGAVAFSDGEVLKP